MYPKVFGKFVSYFRCQSFFSTNTSQTIPKDSPLFDQLGGEASYQKACSIFDSKIKKNPILMQYFKKISNSLFLEHQKNILSVVFGKEFKYSLKDMKNHHSSHFIREMDFDLLIKEVKATLKELSTSEKLIQEGIGHLDKMRRFIIAQSLYQKLGGEEIKIKEIVNIFFSQVLKDHELRHFYLSFDTHKLQEKYTKYLISMFGGSHKYSGKDLRLAHANIELTDRHFYLYKRHLSQALRILKYDPKIIEEVLHKMERLRTMILNSKMPFDELGGKNGIAEIVDTWFLKITNDPLLRSTFKDVDIQQLKEKLLEFLCQELGSNEKNVIRDLKLVHAKFHLTDFHVDAFKDCMQKTLEERNVDDWLIRDVLWVLEKNRRDVCTTNIFEIIGGENTINELTKNMLHNVRANDRLSLFFKNHDDKELKYILRSMLSYALGGPRAFRGKDIRVCHEHLKIENKHFDEMKKIIAKVLKDMGIVETLIQQ